jgi:hypothetical protein
MKTTNGYFSKNSRSPGEYLNLGPPKDEAGVPATPMRRFVAYIPWLLYFYFPSQEHIC